jgi:hypothetical protein
MACGQRADIPPNREGLEYVAQEKEADTAGGIERGVDSAREQGRDLRGQLHGGAVVGIIKRLDPQRIARQEQAASPRIP